MARKLVRGMVVLALLGLFAVPVQAQELRRFDLRVEGGKLVGSERTIRVTEGDQVELRWSSDRKLGIHMHGYRLDVAVTPGEDAVMDFTAANTGRFPFEAHMGDTHRILLYLEVYPR